MKPIIVITIALLIAACDPGYVINYRVSSSVVPEPSVTKTYRAESGITESEMREILENVADTYGLSESGRSGGKDELHYSRYWDGASRKHPRTFSISAKKVENDIGWNVSLFEWLVSKQTEYGAKLEATLIKALSVKNNWQVKRVE
ncbi:MAG: hypothetical protein ACC657_18435 [Thiohalomonadales bacterium]